MQRKSNETKYFISFHLIQNQSKYHRLTFNAKLNEKRDRIIETQTTISYLSLKNKPAFYLRFITDDFKSGHLINRRREGEKKRKKQICRELSARKRKTLPGHRFPIPFRGEGAVGFINARGIISARYRSSFPPLRGLPPSSDKTVHFYLESGRLENAKQPSGIASYSLLSDVPSRLFSLFFFFSPYQAPQ